MTENGLVPTGHAGVVTRLLAACVDAVVIVLVTVFADLAAAGVRFVWSPVDFRWPQPSPQLAVLVLLSVEVVYLTVGWATAGRTYGEQLLGLRVLSGRYGRLGPVRSLLRALACVLFPVGLLWSGISVSRRSLQDILLGTVVVYDPRTDLPVQLPRPRRPASGALPLTSPPAARDSSDTEPSRP